MKLRPDGSLPSCYLVSGDEPLLIDEALDALRGAARKAGCTERESHMVDRHFDWDELSASLNELSLFATAKLVELRLPTAAPGDAGSKALRALASRPADGNVLVVITPALNRKTAESAWVSALAKHGEWLETRPPSLSALPAWIGKRLAAAGLQCDTEGAALLAARVEGNLLAAQQEIDKLALVHPPGTSLSVDDVRSAVADGARFDVYQLADAALARDAERAVRVLGGLRTEGTAAPLVLWALVRECLVLIDAGARGGGDSPERALLAAGVWQSRVRLYTQALRQHRGGSLRRLLAAVTRADQVVKGARPGDPWNALLELTLLLAGHPQRPAELAG